MAQVSAGLLYAADMLLQLFEPSKDGSPTSLVAIVFQGLRGVRPAAVFRLDAKRNRSCSSRTATRNYWIDLAQFHLDPAPSIRETKEN